MHVCSPQLIFIHIHQAFRVQYTLFLSRHCKHTLVVVYTFLSRNVVEHLPVDGRRQKRFPRRGRGQDPRAVTAARVR